MARLPGPKLWAQGLWGVRLRSDPAEALAALQRRYGPVVSTGFGPLQYVWLFGPDAHRELFVDIDRMAWRPATKVLIPVDGDTAIVVSDGEHHLRRRRIVQPAFNIRRIDAQVPLMLDETRSTLNAWTAGREVDGYEELRACVRRIVTRALFGDRLSGQADELGDLLQPALDFLDTPAPQLRVDLPWTQWHKAKVARRGVDQLVFSEIEARRRSATDGDDVLTWLLEAADPEGEGEPLTDQEVRDQVVSLIAAGYETTSAAVGWTLWAMLSHDGVWDGVRADVEARAGAGELTADSVRSMTYLDGVVSESMRLWPPGIAAGRKLLEPIEIAGVRLPAGVLAMYSPYVTQRLPELWPDPLAFRPERWDMDDPTYVEPVPLSYIPFGAGPRRCIGFAFALLEIKVLLAELVRTVDLDLITTAEPGRAGIGSLRPKGGVRVRVRRRRNLTAVQ
jgi:cytochrome P450